MGVLYLGEVSEWLIDFLFASGPDGGTLADAMELGDQDANLVVVCNAGEETPGRKRATRPTATSRVGRRVPRRSATAVLFMTGPFRKKRCDPRRATGARAARESGRFLRGGCGVRPRRRNGPPERRHTPQ